MGKPMTDTPKIKKTLTGKYQVHYKCPSCSESLVNDLSDAGEQDACPNCHGTFVVPGNDFKQRTIAGGAGREKARIDLQERAADKRRQTEQAKLGSQSIASHVADDESETISHSRAIWITVLAVAGVAVVAFVGIVVAIMVTLISEMEPVLVVDGPESIPSSIDVAVQNAVLIPQRTSKRIWLDIAATNQSQEPTTIPEFFLLDRNGRKYGTNSSANAPPFQTIYEERLARWETLNPGLSKEGFLAFDLPYEDNANYSLTWTENDIAYEVKNLSYMVVSEHFQPTYQGWTRKDGTFQRACPIGYDAAKEVLYLKTENGGKLISIKKSDLNELSLAWLEEYFPKVSKFEGPAPTSTQANHRPAAIVVSKLKWQVAEPPDESGVGRIGYSFHVTNSTNRRITASATVVFLIDGIPVDKDETFFDVPPSGLNVADVGYSRSADQVTAVTVTLHTY